MFYVLGGVFEQFVPPEGDGKSSMLSKAVGRITVIYLIIDTNNCN